MVADQFGDASYNGTMLNDRADAFVPPVNALLDGQHAPIPADGSGAYTGRTNGPGAPSDATFVPGEDALVNRLTHRLATMGIIPESAGTSSFAQGHHDDTAQRQPDQGAARNQGQSWSANQWAQPWSARPWSSHSWSGNWDEGDWKEK